MNVFRIYIDGLLYHDSYTNKKPKAVFTSPIEVAQKIQRFKEKHHEWSIRVETLEIDPVTKKVVSIQ